MRWKAKTSLGLLFGALAGLTASVPTLTPAQAPAPVVAAAPEPCNCGVDLPKLNIQNVKLAPVQGQAPVKPAQKHGRGRKPVAPEVSARRHRVSNAKHGAMLKALPTATQAAYDAYTAAGGSVVPPIGDQGSCGNCYMWSACKVCSAAQMTAGILKPGSAFMLSVQKMLDCNRDLGGCGGGDEYQVAQEIQSGGCPSFAQYPGAGQGEGRCQSTANDTLYSVTSLVYVDPNQNSQGVASTQSIKNAILAYGYVSVAADASNWDNITTQTITGNGTSIDHAIGATAWDDNHDNGDGSKGAFVLDNQWGPEFGTTISGVPGRAWIKYGADSFGTGAFVAIVSAPPAPPAPPTPVPPGPVPPGPTPPPPPAPPLTPTGVVTIPPITVTVPLGHGQITIPGGTYPVTPTQQSEYLSMPVGAPQPVWVRTRHRFFRPHYWLAP